MRDHRMRKRIEDGGAAEDGAERSAGGSAGNSGAVSGAGECAVQRTGRTTGSRARRDGERARRWTRWTRWPAAPSAAEAAVHDAETRDADRFGDETVARSPRGTEAGSLGRRRGRMEQADDL